MSTLSLKEAYSKLCILLKNKNNKKLTLRSVKKKNKSIFYYSIIKEILKYIKVVGNIFYTCEHIFSTSISLQKKNEFIGAIKNGNKIHIEKYTLCEIANILKFLIRELYDGVIGTLLLEKIYGVSLYNEEAPELIRIIVAILDGESSYIFVELIRVLNRVVSNRKINGTSPKALALIFTPVMVGHTQLKHLKHQDVMEIALTLESIIISGEVC